MPFIERTKTPVENPLKDAGLSKSDINCCVGWWTNKNAKIIE